MTTAFTAFARTAQGSSASRRLRNTKRVPAIVYGGEAKPDLIELEHNPLWYALLKETFHSSILTMSIDGKDSQVLLRDVQYHPYKQQILHVDFQRVEANRKIHMKVPVHYVNQEISPAVKMSAANVTRILNEVEISCLPKDLPQYIEVDLAELKAGESVHGANVKLPAGVSLVFHGKNKSAVFAVASVVEEDATVAAPEAAAPAAAAGKKK